MSCTREQLIADGEARINKALAEVARVARMTKAEMVTEAIYEAIWAIELHRHECEFVPKYLPNIAPITNGDLIETLRLRLKLLEDLREWSEGE
jgi:hypothetical protein